MNRIEFNNGDLSNDLEKIKGYDDPEIRKDETENEGEQMFTLEVADNSYMYHNEEERDRDFVDLILALK